MHRSLQNRSWKSRSQRSITGWLLLVVVVRMAAVAAAAGDGTGVELRESLGPGIGTQVQIELKAEGLYRPGPPPGAGAEVKLPKPLAIDVKTRLLDAEHEQSKARTEPSDQPIRGAAPGRPAKAVRFVVQGASAINGEIRPT